MKSSGVVFTFVNIYEYVFQKLSKASHTFCYSLVGPNAFGEVAVRNFPTKV